MHHCEVSNAQDLNVRWSWLCGGNASSDSVIYYICCTLLHTWNLLNVASKIRNRSFVFHSALLFLEVAWEIQWKVVEEQPIPAT